MVVRSTFCSLFSGDYGRQYLVDRMQTQYDSACASFGTSATQRYDGYVHYVANEDHKAIGHLIESVFYLLDGLSDFFYIAGIGGPSVSLASFIQWPIFGCGFGWEAIVAAWIDADKSGRLQTVLTLDELRREAWDEEFISYRIKAADR